MSRLRIALATLTTAALLASGAGIVFVALEPSGDAVAAPAAHRGVASMGTSDRSGHSTDSRDPAAPAPTVDPRLAEAARADDAPADGVAAVYYASDAALENPLFEQLSASLDRIDDNVFAGTVTADDLDALEGIDGLSVTPDDEIVVEPSADMAGFDWDAVWDTQVTVDEAYPTLAGLRETHDLSGAGQTIAIVDSGIDTKALGLGSGKVKVRKDFSSKTSKCKDGSYRDPIGHGTHVASIAAGSPAGGIQGVAPGAKLVDARVFNCAGAATTSNILKALDWIIKDKEGADKYKITIVNLSLNSTSTPDKSGHDILSKRVNQLVALGVVVTVAAGNEGNKSDTVFTPGTAAHATTIAATNHTPNYGTSLAPYSSTGPTVDFAAPGSSIVAARSTKLGKSTRTIAFSGTSMAAPFAAGMAALVLERDPSAAPTGLVKDEPHPTGVQGTVVNGVEDAFTATDWFEPGHDRFTGHGVIDPIAVLDGGAAAPAQVATASTTHPSTAEWWVKVPARDHPVTISMVSSSGFQNQYMPYVLYEHDGNTISNWVPCNINQTAKTTGCGVHSLDVDTTIGHSRVFHVPASTTDSFLWLKPVGTMTLSFTVHGLASGVEVYTGFWFEQAPVDADLSGAVVAHTAFLHRDDRSPGGVMELTTVATPGVDVTYPMGALINEPGEGNNLLLQVHLTRAAGAHLLASSRVAVYFDDLMVGVISVKLPGVTPDQEGAEQFRYQGRMLDARQLVSGEPDRRGIIVTDGVGNSGRSGHLFTTLDSPPGKPYPAMLRNEQEQSKWAFENQDYLPVPRAAYGYGLYLFDVSANANRPMAMSNSDGSVVTFHMTDQDAPNGHYDGTWYVNKRTTVNGGIPSLILAESGEWPNWNYVHLELPLSTIPLDGWGSPILSADGSHVAYMKYLASGTKIKQALYWASVDDGNASIKRISALFSPNDYVRVVGVTETHVVVERKAKHNSTSAELRVYAVATKKYSKVATVIPGTTTASPDGASFGYIKAKSNSAVCYSLTAKKNYTVGSFGSVYYGTLATTDACGSVIAAFVDTPELPAGTTAAQLVKLNRHTEHEVLATSAPVWDTYRWGVSRGGTNFATVTAVSLAAGDTNGRDDVYVGLHGSPPLTITGDILLSADHPAPGRSASVVAPPWNEGAETRYQWYRGSSPIAGATGSTYTFTSKDVGKTLRVQVSGTKNGYAPTVLWSESTTKVLKAFKSGKTTLTGTIDSGKKLTVKVHGWAPSKTKYTYQWMRDGVPIVGATGKSYTLTPDDAGTTLTALVYPTRSGYAYTEVTSTPRVINELFDAAPDPVIIGDPVVGTTLSVDTTGWSPDPTKFTFQWKRDGKSISKATKSTYKLTSSSAGKKITVTVKASLAGHTTTSRTSAIHQIERIFTTAPKPSISGATEVGKTLTAKTNTWKATPDSFDYQWNRNGTPIGGATASTYELVPDDEAAKITVTVTAHRAGYTSKATTSSSKTVKKVLTIIPTLSLSGPFEFNTTGIAAKGETLSVTTVGTFEPAPVKISYQWKRNGKNISKATKASYKVSSSDVGKQLTVTVTATKSGYSTVVLTSTPIEVLPALPKPAELEFLVNGSPGDPATLTTGDTVQLVTDNWEPPGGAFTLSWTSGGLVVHTGTNYTVQASDTGAALGVTVSHDGYRPAFVSVRSGSVG